MIIAATLLTDRKPAFPVVLEYLVADPLVERIYVNIETETPEHYEAVVKYLERSGKPFDIDYWHMSGTWRHRPAYDQDPARYAPIAQARNMALDWAIVQTMIAPVTHLLFVDSDVRPHWGGLQHLLSLNKPLSGGLVPGRGAHNHVNYVFGFKSQEGPVIHCEHGTSGYLLIARSIFEVQRFRSGPCVYARDVFLCDDPAYATDAIHHGLADAWYIDTRATADHIDDPQRPLTLTEAVNDYHNP